MSEPSVQDQMQVLIEEEVARGMEPYRRLGFPPEVLDELEHLLRFALVTHPTAQLLLRRLCTDPVLVKSDGVDTAGVEEALEKDQGA